MELIEPTAFLTYLEELQRATKTGSVIWRAVNPTTFVWDSPAVTNTRLSFQRIERVSEGSKTTPLTAPGAKQIEPKKRNVFVFQAFDLAQPAGPILSLDSAEHPELVQGFASLYELITASLSNKTLEFLRSMLPK